MQNLPELQIGSVMLAPIIVLFVQIAKNMGLSDKLCPWLNLILSGIAYVLVGVVSQNPQWQQPTVAILSVIVAFFGSAGVYNQVKGPLKLSSKQGALTAPR